jgi:Tol biopolymer transport system component
MHLKQPIGVALVGVLLGADIGTVPRGGLAQQSGSTSELTEPLWGLKETEIPVTGRAAGILGSGRVSPDGRYISFGDQALETLGGTGNLALFDIKTGTTTIVTKDSNLKPYADGRAEASAWSPNGTRLAYSWRVAGSGRKRELRIVDRQSGRHHVIFQTTEAVPFLTPFAISADERYVLSSLEAAAGAGTVGKTELALISIADGAKRTLKTFDGSAPGGAVFSPDGNYVAYDFLPAGDAAGRDLALVSVDTGREHLIADPATNDVLLGWLPDGRILFRRDGRGEMDAWALPVSNGAPQGAPVLVKRNVGQIEPQGITRDGRVFVWKWNQVREVYVTEVDSVTGRALRPSAPIFGTRPFLKRGEPAWSPDGSRIAYAQSAPMEPQAMVVQTVATNELRVYPVPVRNIDWVLWSPNGQALLFDGTGRDNVQRMFRLGLESGEVEPASDPRRVIIGFSPDGSFVYEIGGGRGLSRRNVADGATEVLGAGAPAMALSPDAKWVAYIPNGPVGQQSLAVRPVSGGAGRVLVEKFNPGYARLTWTKDSKYIVFNVIPDGLHRVPVDGGPMEPLDISGVGWITEKSMNADGRRLAFAVSRDSTELWMWDNVVSNRR